MLNEKNKRRPSVAVAIPNLNQGIYLETAIESILSQENIDTKIAILDAGSTDNSLEIISKYSNKLDYWRSFPDSGQSAAINEGISKLPNTDYVCWLNADDVFLPEGLTKMLEFLESNPLIKMVYAKAYITDKDNNYKMDYPTRDYSRKALAKGCFICQPATLIRREAWKDLNGVDESLIMCMDYDLWWRISELGEIAYLNEYVACSRDHDLTKTNNQQNQHYMEAFQTLKKYNKRIPMNWIISRHYLDRKKQYLNNCEKVLIRIKSLISFIRYNYIEK